MKKFPALISTFFYFGKFPFAPGTIGSLAAFPIWFLVNHFLGSLVDSKLFFYSFWLGFFGFLFFLGSWAATIYSKEIGRSDPGEIVVDEVLGQLITLLLISIFIQNWSWITIILSFGLFRFFDIVKPLFIKSSEKWLKDGYGVMIDDVLSGIMAAATFVLFNFFTLNL